MVWEEATPHQKAPWGMTERQWTVNNLSCETFHGYIQEKTKSGKRIPNEENHGRPTVGRMHFDGEGVKYVFANCRKCMNKNFSGNCKSGMDIGVQVTDPSTARLGRCGCVCCTECFLESRQADADNKEWVACPACGYQKAQHKNEIFWIVNKEYLMRMEDGCMKIVKKEPTQG
jgi:hypothetical protein